MSTTFDWSKYEKPKPVQRDAQGVPGEFDWSQYEPVEKKDQGKVASSRNALLKGLLSGAQQLSGTPNMAYSKGNLISADEGEAILERDLPDLDEDLEQLLKRGGKNAPTALLGAGGPLLKLAEVGLGTVAGHIAAKNGAEETGQALAEAAGFSLPSAAKAVVKTGAKILGKGAQEFEKLESGLTKINAVEAKNPKLGKVTKTQQKNAIQKINSEAADLATKTLEKERPLIRDIESGHNFEAEFNHEFGKLKDVADKSNPVIEVDPLVEFLGNTYKEYKGIPNLHPEAVKILKEIRGFAKNPQEGMKNLLKIYRSNNKKIKGIYETSRLTGKQQEYVDFLTDMNKNITKSFENTLGAESPWVQRFKANNARYKAYKDAIRSRQLLEPIIGKNPKPATLGKLAQDPKTREKLALAIGEKGADEIVQLAKDQKLSLEAIKKIPAKDLSIMEQSFPISILLPGASIPHNISSGFKLAGFAKRGYGWFLTTPKARKYYGEALKAIQAGDTAAYGRAISKLVGVIQEPSEEEE